MFTKYSFLWLIFVIVISSCEKQDTPGKNLLLPKKESSFFVLNEGNFGQGNASLCLMDFEGRSDCDIFSRISEIPLGDVLHSATLLDDQLYLVVNGSGRLVRVQLPDLELNGVIDGLGSPRVMLPLTGQKAYVSDLFSSEIHIIDLEDFSRMGAIPFAGWIEEMVLVGTKVWAVNPELFSGPATENLIIIDPLTDQVTGSFAVGRNPVSIQSDPAGDLWVLCAGSIEDSISGQLIRVDPFSLTADTILQLPPAFGGKVRVSAEGNLLALLLNEIFLYDTGTGQLDQMASLNQTLVSPYGLEFDPRNVNELWVTDAVNFSTEGRLIRWDTRADEQKETRQTGINPNGLIFY